MKGDDIQFAVVSPFEALSNLDISPDKVASELIPLRDKRFEVIACQGGSPMVASVCGDRRCAVSSRSVRVDRRVSAHLLERICGVNSLKQ